MTNAEPTVRYASRRSGWLALTTFAIFVVAVLQAGVIQDAFRAVSKLRILLPDSGLSGLSVNSPVQILGTNAGRVTDIVIHPNENLHADVEIKDEMKPFLRRDSRVFIRRQFGVAGAAYLEITRGRGEPLDWDFAVLSVETQQGASDNVDQLITDVRARLTPILEDAGRAITAFADLTERIGKPGGDVDRIMIDISDVSARIARGQGSIGRLINDDTLARSLETAVSSVNARLSQVDVILTDLETASGDVVKASRVVGQESGQLGGLIGNTNQTLVSLNNVLVQLSEVLPQLVEIADTTTATLPTFLTQTQKTLFELETMLQQLQGHWLLGRGRGQSPTEPTRLSPLEIRQ